MCHYVCTMINDVVGKFQLAKVDQVLHPMFSGGRTVRMQIDPAVKLWLWFCRSGEGPASSVLIRGIVTPAVTSTVLVPAIRSWHYLDQDVITLLLPQAAHIYLDWRKHASTIKQEKDS